MLNHLQIENYALIDKLDIKLNSGFTTITGETGAGKSILLGALSLILGHRADIQSLMDKSKKCIIEGSFSLDSLDLKNYFEKNDLDYSNHSTFRREINQQGKSRAFINDTPVNLSVMKELGDKLIDVHSQHQNLLAADTSFQYNVIDNFCKQLDIVGNYKILYLELQKLTRKNEELKETERKARVEHDYYCFQLDELESANLNDNEFEQMEADIQILENAELIKYNFEKSHYILEDAEPSTSGSLNEALQLISQIEKVSPKYAELYERLNSALIEIKDISGEIARLSEDINFDQKKINNLKQRFDQISKLLLKHNSSSINELIIIREAFRGKVNNLESLEEQILENEKAIFELNTKASKLAEAISNKRKKSIPGIEKEVIQILNQLGMPNAGFKVNIFDNNELNIKGKDNVEFFFNANMGGELKEISKVASGGELSRLMLSIKSIISRKNLLPTIIFDEIDTGISGEIASKMGDILNNMSEEMQVISITHLPQIAARGSEHLLVYKVEKDNKTKTMIKTLSNNERIIEVAQMLGGKNVSEGMIQTAKELMNK